MWVSLCHFVCLVYFLMPFFSLLPCTWPQRPVCSERLQIEQLIKAVMTQAVLLLSSRSIIYAVTISASVHVGFKDDRSALVSSPEDLSPQQHKGCVPYNLSLTFRHLCLGSWLGTPLLHSHWNVTNERCYAIYIAKGRQIFCCPKETFPILII